MQKLGIVFSSHFKATLLGFLGIWIVELLIVGSSQVFTSYFSGTGFDVSVEDFLATDVILFLPYFLVTSFMLRSLAARFAFSRQVKRQITTAEYQPPAILSPAEAGLLIDNEFSLAEVAATVKDLELRGCIEVARQSDQIALKLLTTDLELSAIEINFVNTLFSNNDIFKVNKGSSMDFLSAGQELADNTRAILVADGELSPSLNAHKSFRIIFNIFLIIALYVQSVWTYFLLTDPEKILTINYPRYPMNLSEPISMTILVLLTVTISLSGFWSGGIESKNGYKNWRYVAGLRVYIDSVYKDRFQEKNPNYVSAEELLAFYPYAIAMGTETEFTESLRNLLFSYVS